MFLRFRSVAFQLYFYLSVSLASTIVALVGFWPIASFVVAREWCRSMMIMGRVMCGMRYEIEGAENLPDSPSVIMIKHSSAWEAFAQVVLFPRQAWVLKKELFWVPFFGLGLLALKPIAINRRAGTSAVKQVIRQGQERLAEGIWITVFPEGTRVAPGTTRKYGISAAALAHEAGVPVVPVAHNAGDFWPRRSLLKRPGLIRVVIGPPIDGAAQPPKETNRMVQEWIEARMREISDGYKDADHKGSASG